LQPFRADQGRDFAGGILMPSGFAIERFDQRLVTDHQFRVVAVGQLHVECIGAGFAAVLRCDGAFESNGLDFRESVRAARSLHVLIQDFGGVLRVQRRGKTEQEQDEPSTEQTSTHRVHP
jgi:hypothetical protein